MRWLLLLPLLFITQTANANPLFGGFTADYEVTKNGTVLGISHRQLVARSQGALLDYASTTIPTGFIAIFISDRFMEHSLVKVTPAGIQPQQYDYQRTGGKKEIIFQARFDWRKKLIQRSGVKQAEKLLTNTQDLLSFQLALIEGLTKGRKSFSFNLVDHKRSQLQKLVYTRTLQQNSSLGQLDIIELKHQSEKKHYYFTFWCARQLNYMPVQITKTEADGDVIQLNLKRFNKKRFWLTNNPEENGNE